MVSLEDLQVISRRAEEQRDFLTTEESIKTALVLPFIGALGYDYHNPSEVAAELAADVGTRSHEKVDYAILRDGKPIILFECKALANSLGAGEMSQLTRYFNNTDADIGILTNGVVYKFFSDLDKPNIMDQSPFLEVDVSKANQGVVADLQRFTKDTFDPEETKAAAKEASVIRGVKANMERLYENPEEEFSRLLLRNVVGDRITKRIVESHHELVKRALQEFVRDQSGADSSGEFPQEIITNEPQSDPEPAPVILPNALPVAPTTQQTSATTSTTPASTGEWHSLSDIQPGKGHPRPTGVMFPDYSSVDTKRYWADAMAEMIRWLVDNGRLSSSHCPYRLGKRYLIAEDPVHPTGKDFSQPREVSSLYIETNYNLSGLVRNATLIIELAGMDASQFKVRW